MAKTENNKKVPGALIAVVVVIVAIAAFVPTVYMPYKNKKPKMDSEHQEALNTMSYWDESIRNQATIEADIANLTAQWEKYRKDMFVEPMSTLKDLNTSLTDQGMRVTGFSQGDAQPDDSGTVTAEGNPLYYTTVTVTAIGDRDQLLNFLKYVEEESIGAYYVKTLESKPIEVKDSDSEVIGESLETKMTIYLYYFNQDVTVAVATDTDTSSS